MPGPPDGIAIWKQMIELNWTPKFTLMIRAPEGITWADTFGKNADGPTIFPGWQNGEKFPGVDSINARFQKDNGRPADLRSRNLYFWQVRRRHFSLSSA